MDQIWVACNFHKSVSPQQLSEYYSHPVWLLNGLFIEQHHISMQHRHAIGHWINQQKKIKSVLEYGSGFGTLARTIAQNDPGITVHIHEPYPHPLAVTRISEYPNIQFVSGLSGKYDCLVSTDVLEHVHDPLQILSKLIATVKNQGFLLLANNFYPVIKCHLSQNYHFRYTFSFFTWLMGMDLIGPCTDSHGQIYQKNRSHYRASWRTIRALEILSKRSFPLLSAMYPFYGLMKRRLRRYSGDTME